jgi:hypothetical protein
MAQSQGKRPSGGTFQRVSSFIHHITGDEESDTVEQPAPDASADYPAPAPVPDVAGRDVAPVEAAPAPAPVAAAPPAVGEGGDIELLRNQLGEVVTNFRSRLDRHEQVLNEIADVLKSLGAIV